MNWRVSVERRGDRDRKGSLGNDEVGIFKDLRLRLGGVTTAQDVVVKAESSS